MISDSITNASATAAPPSTSRDCGKKKRNNKSAKIKQNKLGLRREQWLSQVAVSNKGGKEESSVNRSGKPDRRSNQPPVVESLDGVRREEDSTNGGNTNLHHESFMESPSNSSMGGTDISTNYSGRSSRSSSSSSGFCSGNITEEDNAEDDDDDDDDGCVDDWEAVADALAAEEENEKENHLRESAKVEESVAQSSSNVGDSVSGASGAVCVEDAKQDCLRVPSRKQKSNRAWRPDDDLRPQGLPNLAKQLSFPELDKRYSSVAIPSSCPICYEDLDLTDSNFLPCPCGFRLCLFCHKTICDGDGRCPGCRKPYERIAVKAETSIQGGGGLTIRLARSSSMFCKF
ncbi:PREDICTED: probable serine/threonine-protein kinase ifkB [Camelina sativa]|uniref:Probable serine/threonine-protein kinase ifkB n=1 Tax=Camelina sativa TaxID=90675 RepID=A0ABM0UPH5_CAMSA|nr:PREDICTED: probable serine/threonine-protein kinase ifkB [Camelina sativa]